MQRWFEHQSNEPGGQVSERNKLDEFSVATYVEQRSGGKLL